jgi:hypothetical protein
MEGTETRRWSHSCPPHNSSYSSAAHCPAPAPAAQYIYTYIHTYIHTHTCIYWSLETPQKARASGKIFGLKRGFTTLRGKKNWVDHYRSKSSFQSELNPLFRVNFSLEAPSVFCFGVAGDQFRYGGEINIIDIGVKPLLPAAQQLVQHTNTHTHTHTQCLLRGVVGVYGARRLFVVHHLYIYIRD